MILDIQLSPGHKTINQWAKGQSTLTWIILLAFIIRECRKFIFWMEIRRSAHFVAFRLPNYLDREAVNQNTSKESGILHD
jgi:hypothetical protein